MSAAAFLELAVTIGLSVIPLSVVLAFIRLSRGPTLADRVVALDMMTVLIVAFAGLYAIQTGEAAFLDVVIVIALVGFLATVALARYAERRHLADHGQAGDAP